MECRTLDNFDESETLANIITHVTNYQCLKSCTSWFKNTSHAQSGCWVESINQISKQKAMYESKIVCHVKTYELSFKRHRHQRAVRNG